MDFHTLSRKELQALCKKNKIPANITNVAMADALSVLPLVEGLDEILNPKEGDIGTPSFQIRTASRTTTQRKGVKEPESSMVSTRPGRGTRTGVDEQENKDANVSATPAMVPSSRRRAPAVSTRRKKVVEDADDGNSEVQEKPMDVPKTPAVAPSSRRRVTSRYVCNKNETPSGTSVQKAYSTRRSMKLLGKSLSEMSLMETEDVGLDKIDDVSEELSSVSQHVEDSSNTEKGDSLQTESIAVSESAEELEVSSLDKAEDGHSRDLGSEEQLISGKESNVEDELQAEPQEEGSGIVEHVEAEPEEEGSGKVEHVEPEPNDSSLNLQGSFDGCGDSKAGSELLPELEDSGDSAKVENKECNEDNQDALNFEACEDTSMEIAHQKDVSSTEEVLKNVADGNVNHVENFEASEDVSMEIAEKKDVSSIEEVPENVADGNVNHVENFEASEEVSVEIDNKKVLSSTEVVLENVADDNVNHIENFEPMYDDIDEADYNKDVLSTEGVLEKDSSSSEDRLEEALEIKSEHQVDETFGNFGALNIEVEDVAVQLSLLGEDQITEDQKDISEKLEAEESEVAAGEDDTVIDDGNVFLSVKDGIQMSSHQQVESNGISNTLVVADGENNGSSETMTAAQLNQQEQALSDVAIEPVISGSLCRAQSEETKEVPTVTNLMKENLIADFQKMSLRGLKKKLKDLDGKSKSMADNDAVSMQEGERKRTALQALPQNQLTTGEDRKDV